MSDSLTPLASLLRPLTLDDMIGQEHLVGEGKPMRRYIEAGKIPSIIFYGPPGSGKTSLAAILSRLLPESEFHHLSGVLSKKEDVVKIIQRARKNFPSGRQTILFLDEIHRWMKSQQDVLLPFVEKGIVTLIGATTENPSFTVNNALLSRTRVYRFEAITAEQCIVFLEKNIEKIQERYPEIEFNRTINPLPRGDESGVRPMDRGDVGYRLEQGNEMKTLDQAGGVSEVGDNSGYSGMIREDNETIFSPFSLVAHLGNGDLRNTLNILETACILQGKGPLEREIILQAGERTLLYDRDSEEHYNLISAMHKSLRDSDGDAAIYWIGRILAGGEDPRYVVRRMMNFASEDVSDPQAMILANTVYEICEKMGMPECELPILNLAYFLADLPKDNRIYSAMQSMKQDIAEFGTLSVPLHLRNAPTKLMKDSGYGAGYEYAHDLPEKKSTQEHFPEELRGRKYRK